MRLIQTLPTPNRQVPPEKMTKKKAKNKTKNKTKKNSERVSKIFTTLTFHFEIVSSFFKQDFSRKILSCFEGKSFVQNGGRLRSPRVRASYQVGENLFSSGLHLSFFEFHRSFGNLK